MVIFNSYVKLPEGKWKIDFSKGEEPPFDPHQPAGDDPMD
jgi:hypothetical protein